MIEVVIRKYLMETLGVPVYLEYPENPEDEFIVMEKTGGTENHIYTAMMAVQSYGESLYDAAVLNGKAISAMLEMAKLNDNAVNYMKRFGWKNVVLNVEEITS